MGTWLRRLDKRGRRVHPILAAEAGAGPFAAPLHSKRLGQRLRIQEADDGEKAKWTKTS